jgi:hypothetical protein
MKKRSIVFAAVLLAGMVLFGSCYTSKKGIVPCPHGHNEMIKKDLGDSAKELA